MTDSWHRTVIAAAYVVSIALYSRLPGPYLSVDPQFPFARPMIAFMLPTAAAVTYVLLGSLWIRDRTRGSDPIVDTTYKAIIFQVLLFLTALHTLLLTNLIGVSWIRAWAGRGVLVLLGLLLMGVGNLLPRTRPNLVIGFRTSRTIADRRIWMQTHRIGGYVAVCLGAVVMASAVFVGGRTLPNVLGTAAIVAATALFVSYRRHARA